MKKFLLVSSIAFGVVLFLKNINLPFEKKDDKKEKKNLNAPNEHFYAQRMYPFSTFDIAGYEQALQEAAAFNANTTDRGMASWTTQGPFNIGARITTMAVQSDNSNIVYAGFSDGGVWKTTDGGANWNPIFDKQNFLCIAHIKIDPKDNKILYVATGDPDISGYPSIGDGLYKSTDGGLTWKNIGLGNTRIITKVEVNPLNTNILYAGTMGVPFEKNQDRGFYKSADGGTTWKKTLFVSDSTGVIDLVMNPTNPNILYAATWDRIRSNKISTVSGKGARIYKSIDAGETWTQLTNGLPSGAQSRIGLAIYEKNPDILYTSYVGTNLELKGIYKTSNAGVQWDSVATTAAGLDDGCMAGFGWYFGKIRINPTNPDDISLLGVELWRKKGAQDTWAIGTPEWWLYDVHADKHDLVFTNDNKMYLATDGGAYKSTDNGKTWQDMEDIPCTQFYRIETSPHNKGVYYGGAQDNGSTGGNAAEADWPRIYGGDGFQMRFHPTDPETYFVETQNGNISVTFDDGDNFFPASDAIPDTDRRNWDMPYLLSPHNPLTVYTGTYKVYKGYYDPQFKDTPLYDSISPDLTKGNIYGSRFHTISTIEESPTVEGLMYVGTTDGNVWRTDDAGKKWNKITAGLPDRYVTKVLPLSATEVVVTFSGYKYNDFTPHIFYSKDKGTTWQSIKGNLPNVAINDVCILPANGTKVGLAVATDAGIYIAPLLQAPWSRLGDNMPLIKVYSIKYDKNTQNVVAGTYARSIQTCPYVYVPPVGTDDVQNPKIKVFPTVFSEQLHITSDDAAISNIAIFDMNGKNVYQEKTNDKNKTLIFNNLSKGTYIVHLTMNGEKVQTRKVVKL